MNSKLDSDHSNFISFTIIIIFFTSLTYALNVLLCTKNCISIKYNKF